MVLNSRSCSGLKEIGWNGIRIALPLSWHPAAVDPNRLLFENDQGPTMEMRWQGTSKGGSFRNKIYRRLRRAAKLNQCVLEEMPPPGPWRKALKPYTVSAFCWKGRVHSARGVVAACPRCGKVTLLQFYRNPERSDPRLFERILSTFRDHDDKNAMARWAIFDIGVELPGDYRLVTHKFAAGAFQLNFKHMAANVSFYRFAPASVILAKQSLVDFCKDRWPVSSKNPMEEIDDADRTAIVYLTFVKEKPYKRILDCCFKRKKEAWVRVWHLKNANRIHAVRVEGNLHDPQTTLADMADKFSHVQERKQA